MIESALRGFGQLAMRSPGIIVLFLAGMTLLAALLLPRFEFETDLSRLLPSDNPVVQWGRELEAETNTSRILLADLRGDALRDKLPQLLESLRASPFLVEVAATREEFLGESWAHLEEAPLYYLDAGVLRELEVRLSDAGRGAALAESRKRLAEDPLAARDVVLEDPLGLRWIITRGATASLPFPLATDTPYVVLEDGTRALLRLTGSTVPYDLKFARDLIQDVRTRLAVPGITAKLYGDYAQAQADSRRIRQDLKSSAFISVVLVGLFLGLSMRRVLDPLFVFLPVLLAIFWTLPLGSALLGPMTPLTVSAAAILIGLGVDFSIHYLVRYAAERQRHDHRAAILGTLEGIGRPLVASMVTTVAAFLSLVVADFSGLRVFGMLLAMGLGFAFLSSVLTLSLLLGWRARVRRVNPRSRLTHLLEIVTDSKLGKPVAGALLLTTVAGFALAVGRGVHFASDLAFLRPANDAVAEDEKRFEADLGFAIMPVALFLEPATPPERIAHGVAALRREAQIGLSQGPHVLYPTAARSAAVAAFRARTTGWVAATLDDLDRLGFQPEPFRAGLERFERRFLGDPSLPPPRTLALSGNRYQLVVCHPTRNIQTQAEWHAFQSAVNRAFGREVQTFHVQSLLAEIHHILNRDLIRAAIITAVVAGLLVAFLSRGLWAGLLVLLPSVCGFGVTLGTLALFDIPLNMGNCVCIPFLLGIGVDHGVHLVAHFQRTGANRPGACGVAIWRSSMTTILGFGSLISAQTPGIASLGMISILGVATCLLASLLVLPILWSPGMMARRLRGEGTGARGRRAKAKVHE